MPQSNKLINARRLDYVKFANLAKSSNLFSHVLRQIKLCYLKNVEASLQNLFGLKQVVFLPIF